MLQSRKEDFYQIHQFYPQIISPWGWWGIKFTKSCILFYICYISNLVDIGQVVLEKKILADYARRTTTDAKP